MIIPLANKAQVTILVPFKSNKYRKRAANTEPIKPPPKFVRLLAEAIKLLIVSLIISIPSNFPD